ncbi:hypothetical protein [Microbacterium sp. C7(2022)]|uniref:hypothetical protein n=1 Tax=Microbacterium sp. C7(2022) TaxID=2992759 RepID=UPI00237A9ABA|nr:hypothetical protein [Microbacterium sp. C7(2022)]MDE0546138.1 hypothetical protein [Microbacterium sp. C7(2022)]
MTATTASSLEVHDHAAALPGAAVIARIRRLLIVAVTAVAGYAMFMTASKGYCPGGITGDGRFLDAAGNPTDLAPSCISMTLQPSGLVYLALAAIVIGALTRVLNRAGDESSAVRILDRAAAIVAIVAVASVIISQVWFSLIPITSWDGTGTFVYPFPFGSVEMTTSPMTGS